jgi:sugar phosphate isomerase/epimerase
MNRREFLADSATLFGAGAMWPPPGDQDPARQSGATILTTVKPVVRLGGPVFTDATDPVELARVHRRLGYRAAYGPSTNLKDLATIRAIADAFRAEDVVIAEVGRWVNLLDPDSAKRRANLETVTEGLALADALGALCCVDIAGSFNPDVWYGPHPDNLSDRFFDAAVENARTIIDAVRPTRARFCYEMMGWTIPDSPASFIRLLKAVDRPAFGVHLDPCNLVNSPARFYRNTDLLNECFDTLGQWIVSCHAKDLTWEVEMNIHFREVRPGAGSIDYDTYVRRLSGLPQRPPLMLEHMPNAEEYDKGRKHLFELGREIGIDIEASAS